MLSHINNQYELGYRGLLSLFTMSWRTNIGRYTERVLFILLVSCLLFFNPMIALRSLFSDNEGILIGMLMSTLLSLMLVRMFLRNYNRYNYNGIMLLWFGIYSITRFILVGAEWRWQIIAFISILLGVVASYRALNKYFQETIICALMFAMIVHSIVIIFMPMTATDGIELPQIFGMDISDDLFVQRAMGFTTAPGFLSLLSIIGLAISIQLMISGRIWPWILLFSSSLFCGISTGNRSFLVGVVVIIIMTIILSKLTLRFVGGAIFIISIIVISMVYVFSHTIYGTYMYERFIGETFTVDFSNRIYGEMGIVNVVENIWDSPFLGSADTLPGTNTLAVFVGRDWFMPHNSFIWIIGSRGVIAGVLFIVWNIIAVYNFWKLHQRQRRYNYDFNSLPASLWLIAFIAGQAGCLADPLLETPIMMFLLGMGIGLSKRYRLKTGNPPLK